MKGGGAIRSGGGGGGGGLMRTRLRLPVVLLSCSLFFLAGFLGSLLFTQVTNAAAPARRFVSSRARAGL
jgi:prolyl 4-hydroxylase